MTTFFRAQDRTIRLNGPVIPTIDAPRAKLATYLESCYGLINTPARDTGEPRGTQERDPGTAGTFSDLLGGMPADALTPFQPPPYTPRNKPFRFIFDLSLTYFYFVIHYVLAVGVSICVPGL